MPGPALLRGVRDRRPGRRTTGLVPRGAHIRLAATAGASSQFRWRDGCAGTARSCEATVTGDTTAIATFNGANYVFVTSQAYRTDLGLDGYDRACNERARIAGLPGPYLAWLSTAHADASSRFSSARGFIRVDGRPFTDTLDPRSSVYYPPPRWTSSGRPRPLSRARR